MPRLQNFLLLCRDSVTDFFNENVFLPSLTKMLPRGNVAKNNKTHFSMFYTPIKQSRVFDQSEHANGQSRNIINEQQYSNCTYIFEVFQTLKRPFGRCLKLAHI